MNLDRRSSTIDTEIGLPVAFKVDSFSGAFVRALESQATGLLAWKRGQPGQVGNEAAPTVATSAEIRLVNLIPPQPGGPQIRPQPGRGPGC